MTATAARPAQRDLRWEGQGCSVLPKALRGGLAPGRFQDPPREVGRHHIASAKDRGDAPAGEPLGLLEDRGDPQSCGRLDSACSWSACIPTLIESSRNEQYIVEDEEQVVEHLGDRTAAGDAVGDRIDAVCSINPETRLVSLGCRAQRSACREQPRRGRFRS